MKGLFRRWLQREVKVAWHPAFRLPFAGLEAVSGMDPRRAAFVLTWLMDRGIVDSDDVIDTREMPWSWAKDVHAPEYLASLDRPETIASIMGIDPARVSTVSALETWRHAVDGTVAAALHAAAGGRAACLLGGFHHAGPARGAGFCALADVAIAIRRLRKQGYGGHITIYDLDAHPPDGLAECLAGDSRAAIASIGVESEWRVAPPILDLRVPRGGTDAIYLRVLDRLLEQAPPADLAFVLAGADPLAGDRFGGLACTEAGLYERDRRVLAHLHRIPVVLLPAGGYTQDAWRVFAHAVALLAGSRQRVRARYDPLLRRSRDIARTLDRHALGQDDDDWSDIAEDLHLGLPSEPRVLGFYTQHGLEYAFWSYGLLPDLARMGFRELCLEAKAGEFPHLIRVTAQVEGSRQVLVDLALSFRDIEGNRTVFVDWLSLRDPRTPFHVQRPALPGQDAPGLGLAKEFGQLLLRIAERLHLAGVSFVPSHYHAAWMARDGFMFVNPLARAEFAALREVLAGVPLLEASSRLADPGLPLAGGGFLKWKPGLMVAARHPGLRTLLEATQEESERAKVALIAALKAAQD